MSHFTDPQRARNPDYSCIWLLVTGVTALAAAKVEPASSVAAFAIITDATAEGCAIRCSTLGFRKRNWYSAMHKCKENTLLPI